MGTTNPDRAKLESTDNILVMDQAPHEWLLPQVSVVVHHGGIGTVAAALNAGVPQVIKPFLGDQSFWARQVWAIDAGVYLRSLTPATLANAVTRALDFAPRCRTLANDVTKDHGIAAAIERIEHATGLL